MADIVFVCIHNACRSRIAQALARRTAPRSWTISSAGVSPSRSVDRQAAAVLARHGLSIGADAPQGLDAIGDGVWDACVGIGAGDLRPLVRARIHGEWLVPDPDDGIPPVYEALYEDLERRVETLIKDL